MPWEKQFSVDEALSKALAVFWARGYEATSVQDLVESMAINRGSLYATFGDKRSLFIQALRHYDLQYREAWVAALKRSHGPKDAIIAAFQSVADGTLEGGSRDGCLLVNTALELSPHDSQIAEIVSGAFAEMEGFFRDNIERAQANGETSAERDAAETARALLSLFIGLRVLSRSRPEPPLLHAVVRQASALLD